VSFAVIINQGEIAYAIRGMSSKTDSGSYGE